MSLLPIYIHIPRTAGTSVQHYTEEVLGKDSILTIYGKEAEDAEGTLLRKLGARRGSPPRLIRGHFAFGVHNAIAEPTTYFTTVRHPVDRIVSLYNYIRNSRNHTFYEAVSSMTIEDFVTSKVSVEVDNGQVRQLSGVCGEFPQTPYTQAEVPYGKCTQKMLVLALENLCRHFSFVLPIEHASKLPGYCLQFFGWPMKVLPRRNHAKGMQVRELTLEQQRIIFQHNELDQTLYSYVVTVLGGLL